MFERLHVVDEQINLKSILVRYKGSIFSSFRELDTSWMRAKLLSTSGPGCAKRFSIWRLCTFASSKVYLRVSLSFINAINHVKRFLFTGVMKMSTTSVKSPAHIAM